MSQLHKQIPIDPQLVMAKKHAHYASGRESLNQIQNKLQVLQITFGIQALIHTKFQLQNTL